MQLALRGAVDAVTPVPEVIQLACVRTLACFAHKSARTRDELRSSAAFAELFGAFPKYAAGVCAAAQAVLFESTVAVMLLPREGARVDAESLERFTAFAAPYVEWPKLPSASRSGAAATITSSVGRARARTLVAHCRTCDNDPCALVG